MAQTITGLSLREADFLSRQAAENRSIFRYAEVATYWPDSVMAHHALSRLQRGGWLKRIERGLYMLAPLSAGPDRMWTRKRAADRHASQRARRDRVLVSSAFPELHRTRTSHRFHPIATSQPSSKRILDGAQCQVITIGLPRIFGLARRAVDG